MAMAETIAQPENKQNFVETPEPFDSYRNQNINGEISQLLETETNDKQSVYTKKSKGQQVLQKRRQVFEMIKLMRTNEMEPGDRSALQRATTLHDRNPALLFDNGGRHQRWIKRKTNYKPMVTQCCEKKHPTKKQHDLVYVDKLEQFSSQLYDDIERRSNAMKNWQKLRILIVLFQICGNKAVDKKSKKKYVEAKKQHRGCKEIVAPYIIDPKNKYKVAWDLTFGIIYLLSYMLDPVAIAFKFEPLENHFLHIFSKSVTFAIVFDILLVPFTGVLKDDNSITLRDKAAGRQEKMTKLNNDGSTQEPKPKRIIAG